MKTNIFLLFALLFVALSCKKSVNENTYNIKGKLLISSSNPISVTQYKLNFYQRSSTGLLGGFAGQDATILTNSNGEFDFRYNPGATIGLASGGINPYSFSIYGSSDTTNIFNSQPAWLTVESGKNIDIGNIYLYKKINSVIRKVKFSNPLLSNDSIQLHTSNDYANNYKMFLGPIAANTTFIDTIYNSS